MCCRKTVGGFSQAQGLKFTEEKTVKSSRVQQLVEHWIMLSRLVAKQQLCEPTGQTVRWRLLAIVGQCCFVVVSYQAASSQHLAGRQDDPLAEQVG